MKYQTIVADPPWSYNDKLTMSETPRGSDSNYSTMSGKDIAGLASWGVSRNGGVHKLVDFEIADNAFLWLWVTNSFLLSGSGAAICYCWGFQPKQIITWTKGRIENDELIFHYGMGHYTRNVTEHIILATKGQCTDLVLDKGVANFLLAPRTKHSRKPEEAYQKIMSVCPGPYLELFAREKRDAWTSWGNEL